MWRYAPPPDKSSVRVNGRDLDVDKGYLLVVLDAASGDVQARREFNSSWHDADSAALVEFVRTIPPGSPVLVASEFDVSRRLSGDAVAALRELGLREDLRDRFGWAHAAIGVKGAPPGSAVEVVDPHAAVVSLNPSGTPIVALSRLQLY